MVMGTKKVAESTEVAHDLSASCHSGAVVVATLFITSSIALSRCTTNSKRYVRPRYICSRSNLRRLASTDTDLQARRVLSLLLRRNYFLGNSAFSHYLVLLYIG